MINLIPTIMLFSKIDVNKVEWLNLVFENRNQSYGAYVLRKESGNYLFKALLISGFIFSAAIVLSVINKKVNQSDTIISALPLTNPDVVKIIPVELVTPEKPKSLKQEATSSASKPLEDLKQVKFNGVIKPTNDPLVKTEIPTAKQIEISIIGVKDESGANSNSNASSTGIGNGRVGEGLGMSDGTEVLSTDLLEVMPEFPGGMEAWSKFLSKNLRYPPVATENNISGRVVVSFVVERNGEISNLKIVKGIGGGCDEEAMRVIKKSPFWKPGIQNGRAVRVAYMMPIVFRME